MRKTLMAVLVALTPVGAVTLGPLATPAQAQVAVSVSLFYENLAPYGRWFQHPRYGWAWFPTAIDASWQPYSRGRWVWTEESGWYWESDEPFGWAVYHYGRWGYDPEYGWIWIPGTRWGPAWVAFRYSDYDIGWAPLPPETLDVVAFDATYTELGAAYYLPRWVFVPRHYFLDRRVYAYFSPGVRNAYYYRRTYNVTNYVTINARIVNRSIDPRRIEAATHRRIAVTHLRDVGDPRQIGRRRTGEIAVFRPNVRVTRDAAPPEGVRARPGDRPRVAVRRDAIAPSERRDTALPRTPGARPPETARPTQPGAPGTAQPEDRRRQFERRAAPGAPGTPGVIPPRTAQPNDRRREFERRAAPGAPGTVPPGFAQPRTAPPTLARPPAEPRYAPGQPPAATRRYEQPRHATPPGYTAPPRYATPPAARPAPPANVTPGAGPRYAAPRAMPPAPPRAMPPAAAPRAAPPVHAAPPPRAAPAPRAAPPARSAPPAKGPPPQQDNNKSR